MKNILLILISLSFLFCINCNKDSHRRVKYKVVSKSSAEISYTMNNRTFDITEETGEWSVSYRANVGSNYSLSAIKNSPLFNMDVIVYIDGEEHERISTKDINLVSLFGVVP